MVRIIVPLIIGFLLSIVYCLKRIYIKYSKKQELCKNNNYNNIKRADNQLFRISQMLNLYNIDNIGITVWKREDDLNNIVSMLLEDN